MFEEVDPAREGGAIFCPGCGRWLEPEAASFYPARLGKDTYFCRDCVAAGNAPPWIPPSGGYIE